jgi:hypothetical protein
VNDAIVGFFAFIGFFVIFVLIVAILLPKINHSIGALKRLEASLGSAKVAADFHDLHDQVNEKEVNRLTAEFKDSSKQWNKHKIASIYYLASDLSIGFRVAETEDSSYVRQIIRQAYWHATELQIGDPIEARLAKLCEKSNLFTSEQWSDRAQRHELTKEMNTLVQVIGSLVKNEDSEYKPNPPDDWTQC